jgi:excinuclease ABC subunit A
VVVDRLVKKDDLQERLADSLTTCLKRSEGIAVVDIMPDRKSEAAGEPGSQGGDKVVSLSDRLPQAAEGGASYGQLPQELVFSENFACPEHGAVMEELSPRLFSFNSPYGACPHCHGLGSLRTFAAELVVPDPTLPVYAAIAPWSEKDNTYYFSLLYSVGQAFGFEIQTRWETLTPEQQHIILHGSEEKIYIETDSGTGITKATTVSTKGFYRSWSASIRKPPLSFTNKNSRKYLVDQACEVCQGTRLKPESIAVRIGPYSINDLTDVSIRDCLSRIKTLVGEEGDAPKLSARQIQIGELVLREIRARLQFMMDVGLDYLTLHRKAMTLSGGEAQRIRLATQIGSGLTGVLYVLDEPSIGLHQRDNDRCSTPSPGCGI